MAKNLRQKYKEAKKKLSAMNWRLLYPSKPIEVSNVPIRKIRSMKVIPMEHIDSSEEWIKKDIAYDLAKHLVEEGLIDISQTFDPYSGQYYVFADIYVVDKKDGSVDA